MTNKQRADKANRLLSVMGPLSHDPRFQEFLATITDFKNEAVVWCTEHDSVKDARATVANLGEVRAYVRILETAESIKQHAEEHAARQAEAQASGADQ